VDSRYRDRWIECLSDRIQIRAYYFPWGTKRIPYASIRSVKRVEIVRSVEKGESGVPQPSLLGKP